MASQNQSVVDTLSSALPDVIENLQSVLDELRSISTEGGEYSKKQRLSVFFSATTPYVKAFLQDSGSDLYAKSSFPIGAVGTGKPSQPKEKRKTSYGASYQQSRHVSEVKSKKGPSKSKSRMRKSASFQSALEEKTDRHGRRGHSRSEEPAISLKLHDKFYKHEADISSEAAGQDQPPVFPSRLGDEAADLNRSASSDSEDEGGEPWDTISHLQEHPVEEYSANIHHCQVQLKREKENLEERLMHLQITALNKDEEMQQLSKNFETCLHEHHSLVTQYEDLRSELAKKEKECYKLHCKIDQKADANQCMDERDRFEFQLSNVNMALKYCNTIILDAEDNRREYAVMNIVKIAKRMKGLELKRRPWTS